MTKPRARKSARSLRWFSAGCRSTHSVIQLSVQIEQQTFISPRGKSLAHQSFRRSPVRRIVLPSISASSATIKSP
jgi:hypothetical protein